MFNNYYDTPMINYDFYRRIIGIQNIPSPIIKLVNGK